MPVKMADSLTKKQRSYCMSMIRSSHTKPELILKKCLKGFEHNPRGLFGNPDFINWKKRMTIFLDGCFWHMCSIHYKEPKTNMQYWILKLEKNVIRDKEIEIAYKFAGWKVIRVWEHEVKNIECLKKRLLRGILSVTTPTHTYYAD